MEKELFSKSSVEWSYRINFYSLFISLKMRWLGPRIVDKLYQQILSRESIVHRLDTHNGVCLKELEVLVNFLRVASFH